MAIVDHHNLFLTVTRDGDYLKAQCTRLSNREEAVAWLKCQVSDLLICDAGFARYRSPQAAVGYYPLPQAAGIKAHLQAGPALKQSLGEQYQGLCALLLSECIRGVVQAETFLYRERGFGTAAGYDAYWEQMYLNSCRYYSNLDRIKNSWMEYVEDKERHQHLFHRSHTISVLQEDEELGFIGVFMDSFHEIHIELNLAMDGVINEISGRVVRAPDAVCYENSAHIAGFRGRNLLHLSKKDIAGVAGGPQGCNHLVDLLHDISAAAAGLPFLHPHQKAAQQRHL